LPQIALAMLTSRRELWSISLEAMMIWRDRCGCCSILRRLQVFESLSSQTRADSLCLCLPSLSVCLCLPSLSVSDYRTISFDAHISSFFQQNRLEDILTLSRAYTTQYQTLPVTDLPSLFQAYGAYHGRNGQFSDSQRYLELCVSLTHKLGYGSSHPCSSMLQHTRQQLKGKSDSSLVTATIGELSHRILASRTIAAARNNQQVVVKLMEILREHSDSSSASSSVKPSTAVMRSAINTLFECKKYLYYHGWLTHTEMIETMRS
jgi:hypothetical protein